MEGIQSVFKHIWKTTNSTKLFVLNGFGYAVDSLILLIQSIIAGQAALEFNPSYPNGLTIAAYVGMLTGALFWGLTADIMGRKIAFNVSLIICSIFAIVAGASPNWEVLGLFVCLSAFGGGGNLVLDTAVFLEYLPSYRQWMLTLMAAWWGMMCLKSTLTLRFMILIYEQVLVSSSQVSSPGPSFQTSVVEIHLSIRLLLLARGPTTKVGATYGIPPVPSSSSCPFCG